MDEHIFGDILTCEASLMSLDEFDIVNFNCRKYVPQPIPFPNFLGDFVPNSDLSKYINPNIDKSLISSSVVFTKLNFVIPQIPQLPVLSSSPKDNAINISISTLNKHTDEASFLLKNMDKIKREDEIYANNLVRLPNGSEINLDGLRKYPIFIKRYKKNNLMKISTMLGINFNKNFTRKKLVRKIAHKLCRLDFISVKSRDNLCLPYEDMCPKRSHKKQQG